MTGIDADAQTVRIDDAYTLRYDTCIYAPGSVADIATLTVDLDADGRIVTVHNVANQTNCTR